MLMLSPCRNGICCTAAQSTSRNPHDLICCRYNILYYKKHVWIIDVGQAVQLTHPHATKFLYRDIKNVTDFFCHKAIGRVMTYSQVYNFLVKPLPDYSQWVAEQEASAAADGAPSLPNAAGSGAGKQDDPDNAERNTPMQYILANCREALEAAGDNTSNKYKGLDLLCLHRFCGLPCFCTSDKHA